MRFHIISKLLFGFLLLLITNSCKYDTDEVYLNNIDRSKVPAPDLRIQLNLDNDTVYVYGHSTVRLTFQLTNKTLYDVQFYENDKQLNTESFKTGNNSYALDLYMYEHEVTKLRVVFYTSTNSGSIADNLNSEAFINTKEWTLINIPRSDIPLAKTEILDGRLRVSWDPAKTNTKVQYSIRKNDVIYNTYNTWFIDSTFIGGLASYTITADLNASNYETFGSAYYEMPALSINNSDLFSISWNKFKFYNAFKAYRITVGNDINATVFEKGINDTSFIFRDGIYGQKTQVRLELLLNPIKDQPTKSILLGTDERYYPNYPFGMFYSIASVRYPLSGDNCYVWSNYYSVQYLAKFSVTTREYTSVSVDRQSPDSHFSVSPGSKFIMYDAGSELRILEADNLETVKAFSTTRILPSGVYTGSGISDVGTIDYWDINSNRLVVYDLIHETTICSIPLTDGYTHSGILSGNGKYLFDSRHSSLYKIGNNSYMETYSDQSIDQKYIFSQFSPGTPNQLALYDGTQFVVKNCSDFSTVTSFPIPTVNVINVDFSSNKIFTWNNSTFYIFSLTNGQLLNSIPTAFTSDTYLFDNYICSAISQLDLNKLK